MIDPSVTDGHDLKITPRMLRQFAAFWLAFFLALAAWQQFGHANRTAAIVLVAIAVAVGPIGLVMPQRIRPLFALLMAIARPIGAIISTLVIGLIFYGVFTPVAMVFRMLGRDALMRHNRPTGESYWLVKPAVDNPRRYFRQF